MSSWGHTSGDNGCNDWSTESHHLGRVTSESTVSRYSTTRSRIMLWHTTEARSRRLPKSEPVVPSALIARRTWHAWSELAPCPVTLGQVACPNKHSKNRQAGDNGRLVVSPLARGRHAHMQTNRQTELGSRKYRSTV